MTPDDETAFLVALVRLIKPMVAVEVGVCRGETTVHLAAALPPCGTLYALENEQEVSLETAERAIAQRGLQDRIVLVRGDSKQTISTLPDSINFVYVDGDHTYAGVSADTDALWPKMAVNGVLVFHDVNGYCDVRDFIPERFPNALYLWWGMGFALVQKSREIVYAGDGGHGWPLGGRIAWLPLERH